MTDEDVGKVSLVLFTAIVIALCNRHGWAEADAWALVAEAKKEMAKISAMLEVEREQWANDARRPWR